MLTKITLNKLVDTPVAGDKKPSHAIVASDENYGNKTIIGKLWLKEGSNGKFLSGELAKEKEVDGVKYQGFVVISMDEYRKLTGSPSNDTGEVPDLSGIDF